MKLAAILSIIVLLFFHDKSASINSFSAADVDNLSSHKRIGNFKSEERLSAKELLD